MNPHTTAMTALATKFENAALALGWRKDHVLRFRGDFVQFYRHPAFRGTHSLSSAIHTSIVRHDALGR